MDPQPDYRRRRLGVLAAALALLAVANHDRPRLGIVTIDWDGDHAPRVDGALAPMLATVASAVALAAEQVRR